ncbi:hypothetical protein DENSPDRAFT_232099 [Dentipellis sp. KUC8613]|nr:hypothetical protein DENSPDRAFT_232099 [Dentipellis sp. KUC8613]
MLLKATLIMVDCNHCGRWFPSTKALHAHCRDKADHDYCTECDRAFSSRSALQQVSMAYLPASVTELIFRLEAPPWSP